MLTTLSYHNLCCCDTEPALQACVGSGWMPPSSCASNAIATVDCDAPSFRVYDAASNAAVETLSILRPISGELQIRVFEAWYPVCAASFNSTAFTVCNSLRLQVHQLSAPAPCVLWQACGVFLVSGLTTNLNTFQDAFHSLLYSSSG